MPSRLSCARIRGHHCSNFLSRATPTNPHSTRCPASAQPSATSCLGAFWTPVSSACGASLSPASKNLHTNAPRKERRVASGLYQQPDLNFSLSMGRNGPMHKVAALQPAAREQEPRSRWLIERAAIAGWLGSTRSTRVASAYSVWSRPADHLRASTWRATRALTSLLECAVHLWGARN